MTKGLFFFLCSSVLVNGGRLSIPMNNFFQFPESMVPRYIDSRYDNVLSYLQYYHSKVARFPSCSFFCIADAKPKRDSQEDIVQVVSVAVLSTLANSPQEVRLLVQCNTYSNTFLFVRSTFVLAHHQQSHRYGKLRHSAPDLSQYSRLPASTASAQAYDCV